MGILELLTFAMQGYVQAVACSGMSGIAVIAVGTSSGTIAAYQTLGSSDPQQIGKAEAAGAVQSISIILDPLEVCPFFRGVIPSCHRPLPCLSCIYVHVWDIILRTSYIWSMISLLSYSRDILTRCRTLSLQLRRAQLPPCSILS